MGLGPTARPPPRLPQPPLQQPPLPFPSQLPLQRFPVAAAGAQPLLLVCVLPLLL